MPPCPVPTALASSLYVTTQSPPSVSSWEFFTTLGYEWDVIRGRRPYRWTIWVCSVLSGFVFAQRIIDLYPLQIYSITRVATLLSVILNMVRFDTTAPIYYCQVSPLFNVRVFRNKLNYVPKVWTTFIAVSTSFQLPTGRPQHLIYFRRFL
jgi:hypothetical protein